MRARNFLPQARWPHWDIRRAANCLRLLSARLRQSVYRVLLLRHNIFEVLVGICIENLQTYVSDAIMEHEVSMDIDTLISEIPLRPAI